MAILEGLGTINGSPKVYLKESDEDDGGRMSMTRLTTTSLLWDATTGAMNSRQAAGQG